MFGLHYSQPQATSDRNAFNAKALWLAFVCRPSADCQRVPWWTNGPLIRMYHRDEVTDEPYDHDQATRLRARKRQAGCLTFKLPPSQRTVSTGIFNPWRTPGMVCPYSQSVSPR